MRTIRTLSPDDDMEPVRLLFREYAASLSFTLCFQGAAVDPEEAFVASLSSCHMLWFLSIAAKKGFTVDSYRDDAIGVMGKIEQGKLAMTRVTLRPAVAFVGRIPTNAEINAMHHEATRSASSRTR
jgi:organic hydroperoxide reductase OsmC/OhrA